MKDNGTMPGPKMGPRPPDFDEALVKQSPTFSRWLNLENGQKLRYACRDFIKGHGDDEERLMRRIMIARRNNIRDHQVLKRARQIAQTNPLDGVPVPLEKVAKLDHNHDHHDHHDHHDDHHHSFGKSSMESSMDNHHHLVQESSRKRRPATLFSDSYVAKEMDIAAVEATRSYRTWLDLPDGAEFVYNQKYIKGREGHDWLLKKNIWRRMRYRRENKKIVHAFLEQNDTAPGLASHIVDEALLTTHSILAADAVTQASVEAALESADGSKKGDYEEVSAAVEAAMGVADSYAKSPYNVVHNPLDTVTTTAGALDAAARLAAAASSGVDDDAVAAAASIDV
ncbi:unnamed protein product [Cylindrotheca closterium]|uniref:Uncharacterized protein n=1 Tax=Cylindrotheca closterium TaxID=2856 RepID=A0AAD2G3X5_9STRA|nr:unnamed protein product [Cylindrotheca closterium]